MKEPCVWVTGGAGYVGGQVVLALLDAGRRVVVVDNLATGQRDRVPKDVRFVQADVGDGPRMVELLREEPCEAILHLAGSASIARATANPLECYRNNACASRSLIQAAVGQGVDCFIFASSAAVYGESGTLPMGEKAVPAPCSAYGRSKRMVEDMLRDTAATSSLRFVALRYFNVAGADPEGRSGPGAPDATHLIEVACEVAAGIREAVTVFGDDYDTPDGTGIRDYVHVADLAEAHVLALNYLRAGGASEVLNCGSGQGCSVRQVLEVVRRVSGNDFPVKLDARRMGDIGTVVADPERTRRILGWSATRGLTDIIDSAWAWKRQAPQEQAACRTPP